MIRYLFLAAALFGLISALTARHVSWWYAAEKVTRVLIAVSYLFPHHRY